MIAETCRRHHGKLSTIRVQPAPIAGADPATDSPPRSATTDCGRTGTLRAPC